MNDPIFKPVRQKIPQVQEPHCAYKRDHCWIADRKTNEYQCKNCKWYMVIQNNESWYYRYEKRWDLM